MPTRDIKDSCRTSETLAKITPSAERFFWRLLTYADDYGRFPARADVLRAQCFSVMLDAVRQKDVAGWLSELFDSGLIYLYKDSDGKKYGEFVTWRKHQRVRAKHSKYPVRTSADTCQQMPADVAVSPKNPSTTEEPENTEVTTEASALGKTASPAPALIQFRIPTSIQEALEQAPRLGGDARILTPRYWQALVRAHGGVDYGREVLRAEAWMVANPTRAPRKNLARFLASWIGRAEPPDEEVT